MVNENTVEVGSVVKSLDFPSTTDCYYVGVVVSINKADGTFRAKTIKRVWQDGIGCLLPDEVFTAFLPGRHSLDDYWIDARVQVVA